MKPSVVAVTAAGAVTIAALLTGCGSSTPTSPAAQGAPSSSASVASASGTPTAGSSAAGTSATGAATPGSSGTGTGAGASTVVKVGDNDKGHTVTVHQGQRVALVLTGGYWQVAGSSAPAVVRQDGAPSYLAPSPASCAPGVGCRPQETDFSALSVGTATLTASRTSCGEARRCPAGQGSYSVTISVVAA
ncbi:hypothetical protein [Streptacidiphilus rugosus]|uniref:hypothetical protein n=1 Tax=Streptacidiphilus rugosus TaxID=405783 RepID=UPI00055F5211|nr:hypothetical protein [Streptacidiphilus rugosus]